MNFSWIMFVTPSTSCNNFWYNFCFFSFQCHEPIMSQTTLESLLIFPDEILSSVFFHLLIEDRKSVRLTCRRFYEACNTFDILKTEEFNFYGNINSNRAILSLFNVKRKLLNIKINAVRLDSSILPFFGKHGPHIHSLIFHNCMLTDGLLRDIIECCQNMCSFAFIIAVPNRMNHWWDNRLRVMYKLNILADLIALHNNGVVCTQVTKFTLILPRPFPLDNVWDFSNDKFLHIFDVFPNIQKLNIQVDVNSDFHQLSTIMWLFIDLFEGDIPPPVIILELVLKKSFEVRYELF